MHKQNQAVAHKAMTGIRETVMKDTSFINSTKDQRRQAASNSNILL